MTEPAKVVIVGAGFAGIGCARELAKHPHHAQVTVVDAHDYHQFLPLLYQVATFQLAGADVSMDLDDLFKRHDNVSFRQATATSVDPAAKTVTLDDGTTLEGDYLVLAGGAKRTSSAPRVRSTRSRCTRWTMRAGFGPASWRRSRRPKRIRRRSRPAD